VISFLKDRVLLFVGTHRAVVIGAFLIMESADGNSVLDIVLLVKCGEWDTVPDRAVAKDTVPDRALRNTWYLIVR
jgi:hypothetical protein